MLKLIKEKAGYYKTTDGKIIIEKEDGYWYAYEVETSQSVVDSERTLHEIKYTLEGYLNK